MSWAAEFSHSSCSHPCSSLLVVVLENQWNCKWKNELLHRLCIIRNVLPVLSLFFLVLYIKRLKSLFDRRKQIEPDKSRKRCDYHSSIQFTSISGQINCIWPTSHPCARGLLFSARIYVFVQAQLLCVCVCVRTSLEHSPHCTLYIIYTLFCRFRTFAHPHTNSRATHSGWSKPEWVCARIRSREREKKASHSNLVLFVVLLNQRISIGTSVDGSSNKNRRANAITCYL